MKFIDLNPLELFPFNEKTKMGFSLERKALVKEYMSYSRIAKAMKSLMHYKDYYIDGNKTEKTKAMAFGDLVHKCVLTPDQLRGRFVVAPSKDDYNPDELIVTGDDLKAVLKDVELKTTGKKPDLIERLIDYDPEYESKIWDKIIAAFNDSLPKESIIISSEHAEALKMIIDNLHAHKLATKYLTNGFAELAVHAYDKKHDITWYAHIDYLRVVQNPETKRVYVFLPEVKTTKDASYDGFRKEIDNRNYHIQLWIYERILKLIFGKNATILPKHVVIENTRPFIIETYKPAARMMTDSAGYKVENTLRRLKHAMETNQWEGYNGGQEYEIDLPAYHYYKMEEQITLEEGLNE